MLGGRTTWALPYWNYFKPNQFQLPPAFAHRTGPMARVTTRCSSIQRYGPNSDGKVFVPMDAVNLDAMSDPDFTGVASGGSPGFGGVDTGFEHGGRVHGGIETQPHDWVHGLVGGGDPNDPNNPGLMSDPDTAGLDPIFWLHHANIDRLWEVWRQNPPTHIDPNEANWLNGPGNIGERMFSMPMPDGTRWDYTPGEMAVLATLDYDYDDLSPAVAPAPPIERLRDCHDWHRALPQPMRSKEGDRAERKERRARRRQSGGVAHHRRSAAPRSSCIRVARRRVSASLAAAAETAAARSRVPEPRERARARRRHGVSGLRQRPRGSRRRTAEQLAGSVALFGVRKATMADGQHAGQGLTFVLEITKIIDDLHLSDALDVDALDVRIVPVRPVRG